MPSKKSIRKGDIPAKILKDNINVYIKELTSIINSCLERGLFPNELKIAGVLTTFKAWILMRRTTQTAFTCSKLTVETLEQSVKDVQS